MKQIGRVLSVLAGHRYKPRRAIILGAEPPEYKLYNRLQSEGEYDVLFFIDEEPWSHRSQLGHAQLRYPSELPALCENHQIDAIFYCDDSRVETLPELRCKVVKTEA